MPGILGVDPGSSGAAALFDHTRTSKSGLRWIIIDLPKGETGLHASVFRDWLRKHVPEHAFLEWVSPNPRFGSMQSFRLGASFAALKAVLECVDVPVTLVTPTSWKRSLGLLKQDKEASRVLARQLYPDIESAIARKGDHGRAEAALIAGYGVQRFGELL